MFNVFQYDKKLQKKREKEQEILEAIKSRKKSLRMREKLLDNYNKRINQFIISMIKKPVKVKEHERPLESTGRTSDPKKFKGSPVVSTRGYITEKSRIQNTIQSNNFLLTSSTQNYHEFRERHRDKEVNEQMYFKPRNSIERVAEALKSRNVDLRAWKSKTQSKEIKQPKKLYGSLHEKTYFKSLSSLLTSRNSYSAGDLSNQGIISGIKNKLKISNLKDGEVGALAEEALKHCNMFKDHKAEFLKTGTGKLVSNPELTNYQTYEKLSQIPSLPNFNN